MILHQKRNPITLRHARLMAEKEKATGVCPHCGEVTYLYAKFPDRVTYRCTHCQSENTFTALPEGTITGKKKELPQAIMVRDRSKEVTKEVPKESPKIDMEDVDSNIKVTLKRIAEGMKDKKLVKFVYVDAQGKKSIRLGEPYKIRQNKGDLFLYAYCRDHKGIRAFKLSSISMLECSNEQFEPRWDIESPDDTK